MLKHRKFFFLNKDEDSLVGLALFRLQYVEHCQCILFKLYYLRIAIQLWQGHLYSTITYIHYTVYILGVQLRKGPFQSQGSCYHHTPPPTLPSQSSTLTSPLPLTTPVHRVSLVSTHIHLLVLVCNIDKTQVENAVRIVNTE